MKKLKTSLKILMQNNIFQIQLKHKITPKNIDNQKYETTEK